MRAVCLANPKHHYFSWSHKRFEVPYRLTEIDRQNTWGGKVKIMWNVDQVKTMEDGKTAIVGFTKIGTCASPTASLSRVFLKRPWGSRQPALRPCGARDVAF